MENITFRDIQLRLGTGSPGLYCHQSCCEHLLIVHDIRTFDRDCDPNFTDEYPYKLSSPGVALEHHRQCEVSSREIYIYLRIPWSSVWYLFLKVCMKLSAGVWIADCKASDIWWHEDTALAIFLVQWVFYKNSLWPRWESYLLQPTSVPLQTWLSAGSAPCETKKMITFFLQEWKGTCLCRGYEYISCNLAHVFCQGG